MNSLWSNTVDRPEFMPLLGDTKTDVLIIGGGICGILCAYMLDQAGVDYTLVEASRICSGFSANTTAKITLQHGLIYDKIIRSYGKEAAQLYLEINRQALEQYRKLGENIDCDMEDQPFIVYSMDEAEKIENEISALDELGQMAYFTTNTELPFDVAAALRIEHQLQFHPLKFCFALAKGLNIYEKTKVWELGPNGVRTNRGNIRAENIIVATHFPLLNKHGGYFLKLYQHRSYVLALANTQGIRSMYVDESQSGMSFRNYRDMLLLGGGAHRTGKKGGNWQELRAFAHRYYPHASQLYHWATQDCMSLDGIPYIGRYSANTPHLYVASGFNKWGMSSSMAAAMILSRLVQGKDCDYAQVFSPARSMLHPQLLLNAAESVLSLLTPTVPRCPHMGCALKYNPQEHSWDCPCHGSRFSGDGRLLNNPATDDKKR